MATFVTMPKLGMNMVEGHIVSWLVKEGEQVKNGQVILEIETDKATNEVESPAEGILAKIIRSAGEDVPCNSVLAVILNEGETLPASIPEMLGEEVTPKAEASRASGAEVQSATYPADTSADRIRISPSAKKLAQELGVDLSKITSAGSQIKREDVERAHASMNASHPNKTPAGVTARAYSGMRKLTGDAMAASTTATARVPLFLEANAEGLIQQRNALTASGNNISFNVLLAKIVAAAISDHPYMNTQLSGDQIWEFGRINIGIAVDSEKGLFVPVLKDAAHKDIGALQSEFNALAERAMNGRATSEDLGGGTFTITNLGAQEIESFVPVINLPQCAILGVGVIKEKPAVVDGKIIPQHRIGLTLVFDHRLVDGAAAAKFLQKIKHLIEELD
jgi:pyruvate dehydrogenase E2 component (dihydrolipoamide acetyltransferase)